MEENLIFVIIYWLQVCKEISEHIGTDKGTFEQVVKNMIFKI